MMTCAIIVLRQWRMTKVAKKFKGCDEDCLNCPYPDCYKPIHKLKPLRDVCSSFIDNQGKRQPHMYTLELGGVGKNMPNISRKFYL